MASEADQAVFSEATDLFYNDLKPYFVISGSTFIVGVSLFITCLIMAFFYGLRPEKLKFKFDGNLCLNQLLRLSINWRVIRFRVIKLCCAHHALYIHG